MNWLHLAPAMTASFLASFVEFVEAATIVLAVGTVRGWRSALAGTALALLVLCALVLALGPALTEVPERALQLVVGLLLLLFGMRWLRKAILRGAGVLALHDEDAIFRSETANLRLARATARWGVDPIATITAFKSVLLEGVEVAFIVIAVAAGGAGLLPAAAAGAAAAGVLVVALAIAVHRPLARVPENALKFAVGVLISAFGVFWTGEGLGIVWPGQDVSLLALVALMLVAGLVGVRLASRGDGVMRVVSAICHELIGLFVDDGALAVALLLWCAIVGGAMLAWPGLPVAGVALALGCVAILLANIRRTARRRKP